MAKRRANNEGTIYKTESGWRAQLPIGRQRLSFRAKTQKECQTWLKNTTKQVEEGLTFEGAIISLEEFLTDWLVNIQSSRSKGTMVLYQRTINKEILPILGQIKLTDLKPDLIQRLYAYKLKNGQSSHAVHTVHKVLNIALRHALGLGLIIQNPCKIVIKPKPEVREMKILDKREIQVLLSTAQDIRD